MCSCAASSTGMECVGVGPYPPRTAHLLSLSWCSRSLQGVGAVSSKVSEPMPCGLPGGPTAVLYCSCLCCCDELAIHAQIAASEQPWHARTRVCVTWNSWWRTPCASCRGPSSRQITNTQHCSRAVHHSSCIAATHRTASNPNPPYCCSNLLRKPARQKQSRCRTARMLRCQWHYLRVRLPCSGTLTSARTRSCASTSSSPSTAT